MTGSSQKNDPDPRIVLAAERTLLAWIRTGIALMAFGFVVARFGVLVEQIALVGGQAAAGADGGSATGVAVVAAGVLVNLWACVRHVRMVRRLRDGSTEVGTGGPVGVAVLTVIGGLALIATLLVRYLG